MGGGDINVRGRPFQPGNQYGRGRPPGSQNKAAGVCQHTLDSHAENLAKKCLTLAFQGNPTAMRLCMERIMPARRQATLRFRLPPTTNSIDNVAAACESVIKGVAGGKLTPADGQALLAILEGRRRAIEAQDQERRIRALEERDKSTT